MVAMHRMVAELPRVHKYAIGQRILQESIDIGAAAYRVGMEKEIDNNRQCILEKIEIVRLFLRMLRDIHVLSLKYFSSLNVQLEALYTAQY